MAIVKFCLNCKVIINQHLSGYSCPNCSEYKYIKTEKQCRGKSEEELEQMKLKIDARTANKTR